MRAAAGECGAKGNANKSQQPPPPPNKGSMFKRLGHNQQSPDFFLLDLCSKQDSTLKEVFPKPQPAPSPSREQPKSPVSEEGGDSSVHSTAPDLHDVHTHLGTGSRVSRHGGSVVNSYLTRISVK